MRMSRFNRVCRRADSSRLNNGCWKYFQTRQVLSAGEMQQLAFARVLFHRPAFALMDEATSSQYLE